MTDNNETNVTNFLRVVGGNGDQLVEEAPKVTTYAIETVDGDVFINDGFCIFTAQHVAIMRELGDNASIPVLVIPLSQVKVLQLLEDEFDEESELTD